MSPRTRRVLELLLDNLVWLILLVVLAAFSLTVPNYFQFGIFANIIEQSSYVGVMAIGLAMVIIAGAEMRMPISPHMHPPSTGRLMFIF